MEYLEYYDEKGQSIGKEERIIVHSKGYWHKTIHCWLYDELGNVYFQLRADNNKMYTTASGHVLYGETLEQAFLREVKEEIGIEVELSRSALIEMVVWKMDKKQEDRVIWRDRVFANVYANKIKSAKNTFVLGSEVNGLIKINAKEAFNIIYKESGQAAAEKISKTTKSGSLMVEKVNVGFENFLINSHEIGLLKYGRVLQFIIDEVENKFENS